MAATGAATAFAAPAPAPSMARGQASASSRHPSASRQSTAGQPHLIQPPLLLHVGPGDAVHSQPFHLPHDINVQIETGVCVCVKE